MKYHYFPCLFLFIESLLKFHFENDAGLQGERAGAQQDRVDAAGQGGENAHFGTQRRPLQKGVGGGFQRTHRMERSTVKHFILFYFTNSLVSFYYYNYNINYFILYHEVNMKEPISLSLSGRM